MSKNIIKINRGDSYELSVYIPDKKDFTKNFMLTDNDVVYFAILLPHQPFESACPNRVKGYTAEDQDKATGEIIVKIEPNDTRLLTPGVYYYTVKLQRGGTLDIIDDLDDATEVRTIIERTKFIVYD